ncbi:hypothetical protein NEOKW01_0830 [Nematocida sp. AWRm80]|nr:hypothetical protein NEOKW01_0830 [Nematocida sp. AWRm80]
MTRGRVDGRLNNESRSINIEYNRNSILLRKYTKEEYTHSTTREVSITESVYLDRIRREENIPVYKEYPEGEYSSALVIYPTAEIRKPSKENPRGGILNIYSNEKELQIELEEIFKGTNILQMDKLSIIPKKLIWSIRIEAIVIHNKGSLIDLGVLGVLLALENRIGFEEDKWKILCNPNINTLNRFFNYSTGSMKMTPAEYQRYLERYFRTETESTIVEAKETDTTKLTILPLEQKPKYIPRSTTAVIIDNEVVIDPLETEYENTQGIITAVTSDVFSVIQLSFTGLLPENKLTSALETVLDTLAV